MMAVSIIHSSDFSFSCTRQCCLLVALKEWKICSTLRVTNPAGKAFNFDGCSFGFLLSSFNLSCFVA